MSWIKVEDGYVNTKAIEAVRISHYVIDDEYRVMIFPTNGTPIFYKACASKQECMSEIDKLVNYICDCEQM